MAFNKYLRLHNDRDMPTFGFRTGQIKEDDISEALSEAIEAGYRLIETSPAYNNQGAVGDVLAAWLNANKIKRDEIFIVTKLPIGNNRPHEVEEVLTESLRLLQLEYVDLYLVDAPFAVKMEHNIIKRDSEGNCVFDEKTDHKGVWENMETMLHSGLTKAIGIGNFNISQIDNMLNARSTVPHVLQIEYHIYLQQPDVIDYCRKKNIVVLTYAALGAVTAVALLKAKRKSSLLGTKLDLVNVLDLPEVREIAAVHKKSPAHVVLRWIIDKKLALTIKSENANRIRANINIFDFALTQEEIDKLNALNKNRRFVDFSNYKGATNSKNQFSMSKISANVITLNDGNKMPTMGLNTWNIDLDDISFVIRGAINAGYTLIDTSVLNYNETQIGATLKALRDSGSLKRTDVYITTKLPPTANNPESVEAAMLQSLQRLQLDYVDLYLIQAPTGLVPDEKFDAIKWNKDGTVCLDNTTDHIKLWKKMEDLVLKGLTKSIGLANFNRSQINKIIPHCTIIPAVLQIEYHIHLQQPSLIEFCQSKQIAISAYGPLGVNDVLFAKSFTGTKRQLPKLLELPEVKDIAKRYEKTALQVLIRWVMDKGLAFVLRMSNSNRMNEILKVTEFILQEEDVATLNQLDRNFRYVDFKFLRGIESHPEYPF